MASTINANKQTGARNNGESYRVALYSLMLLFFMMGFITCLNDILIPYLKAIFRLDYTQANLINLCFFGAYFVMSVPSGYIIDKIGYKGGMIAGFVVAAIGCFLFFPAAGLRVYGLFLAALFILASGITLLQVAGNPYVAVLGKPETASSRLTLTQAFNSVGTTIAPYFGSVLILSGLPEDVSQAASVNVSAVQSPYLFIGGLLLAIAAVLFILKLPVINHSDASAAVQENDRGSAIAYRHLMLGAIGIFCYVGAEVAIGSHIVSYLQLPDIMGMNVQDAGNYVSYYWGGAMVGRFIGSLSLNKNSFSDASYIIRIVLISLGGFAGIYLLKVLFTQDEFSIRGLLNLTAILSGFSIISTLISTFLLKLRHPGMILAYHAAVSALLVLTAMLTSGSVSMWALLLTGIMNSLMFATIFTLAIDGLGKYTDSGAGILSTAIVGGAVVPFLFGMAVDAVNLKVAFILPLLCYGYIIYYGKTGSKTFKQA